MLRAMSYPSPTVALRWAVVIVCCLAVAALLGACSAAGDGTAERNRANCEQGFADSGIPATTAELDITIRRCAQDRWVLPAQAHPDILADELPGSVLEDLVGSDPTAGLSGYTVCASLELSRATPPPTPRRTPKPTRKPEPVARSTGSPAHAQTRGRWRQGLRMPVGTARRATHRACRWHRMSIARAAAATGLPIHGRERFTG